MPPKDHPIWSLASIALMLVALGMCLVFGYSSEFDYVKDVRTMLVVGLISAVGEAFRRILTQ